MIDELFEVNRNRVNSISRLVRCVRRSPKHIHTLSAITLCILQPQVKLGWAWHDGDFALSDTEHWKIVTALTLTLMSSLLNVNWTTFRACVWLMYLSSLETPSASSAEGHILVVILKQCRRTLPKPTSRSWWWNCQTVLVRSIDGGWALIFVDASKEHQTYGIYKVPWFIVCDTSSTIMPPSEGDFEVESNLIHELCILIARYGQKNLEQFSVGHVDPNAEENVFAQRLFAKLEKLEKENADLKLENLKLVWYNSFHVPSRADTEYM